MFTPNLCNWQDTKIQLLTNPFTNSKVQQGQVSEEEGKSAGWWCWQRQRQRQRRSSSWRIQGGHDGSGQQAQRRCLWLQQRRWWWRWQCSCDQTGGHFVLLAFFCQAAVYFSCEIKHLIAPLWGTLSVPHTWTKYKGIDIKQSQLKR